MLLGAAGTLHANRQYLLILQEIRDKSALNEDSTIVLTDGAVIKSTPSHCFLMNIDINIAEKTDKSITYVTVPISIIVVHETSASRESHIVTLPF